MKRRGRARAIAPLVAVDPELEQQWQAALLSRPSNENAAALAAWNRKHGDLLAAYQQAVAEAEENQANRVALLAQASRARARRRWIIGLAATAGATIIAIVVGISVHYSHRPTEEAACTAYYQRAHGIKLVSRQIDLLQEGEGGWAELAVSPGASPVVGGLDLSPAELQAGKTGSAAVDNEAYVYESAPGYGHWYLLERRGGHLVLTLFFTPAGFNELPHAPLKTRTTTAVTVRAEALATVC